MILSLNIKSRNLRCILNWETYNYKHVHAIMIYEYKQVLATYPSFDIGFDRAAVMMCLAKVFP